MNLLRLFLQISVEMVDKNFNDEKSLFRKPNIFSKRDYDSFTFIYQ